MHGLARTCVKRLTKPVFVHTVMNGAPRSPFFVAAGWEVVQLAVHQILDLIILVRVQASQPTASEPPAKRLVSD